MRIILGLILLPSALTSTGLSQTATTRLIGEWSAESNGAISFSWDGSVVTCALAKHGEAKWRQVRSGQWSVLRESKKIDGTRSIEIAIRWENDSSKFDVTIETLTERWMRVQYKEFIWERCKVPIAEQRRPKPPEPHEPVRELERRGLGFPHL